jgi:hypothetical protein
MSQTIAHTPGQVEESALQHAAVLEHAPASTKRRRRAGATAPSGRPVPAALAWPGGLLAGTLLIAYAYAYAATSSHGQTQFHLFWSGVLLFTAPAALRLCQADVARAERLAIIASLGLFDFLPKFLRSPHHPLFFDELAHWRQANVTYTTGRLFQPNPTVYMSQYFPGLHALTASLRDLSGLPTFQLGLILLALLHVIALLGIFVIAERSTRSDHIAGLAAFIYSLNPSFMFFDSQYAYESLAIVFFIWVIAAILAMQEASGTGSHQAAWLACGLTLAGACIITHHLSTYALVVALLLMAVATTVRRVRGRESRGSALLTWAFALLVTAGAAAWLIVASPGVVDYLVQPVASSVAEIMRMLHGQEQARTLFALGATPRYEQVCAFLSPVVMVAGAAGGLALLRRQGPRTSAARALILFGLGYFPSALFMLTEYGNEGARRSWTFTYTGLAVLIAPVIPHLLSRVVRWHPAGRTAVRGAIVALLCIVLVGDVSTSVNELYRFPGPYVYGSDTRSLDGELMQMVAWMKTTQGTGQNVVADRYSGLALASFGLEWPAEVSWKFPLWQLYFSVHLPSAALLQQIQDAHFRYLVIDRRMARYLPRVGVYFASGEPEANTRTTPPPAAALDKYEHLPWVIKIYQSDNLEIYRFNFAALHVRPAPSRRKWPGVRRQQPLACLSPSACRLSPGTAGGSLQ